ncbi:phosphoribosylglycinamide formyltransferase [Paenibacillus doosanensis]|uniref:Phosphoribosylglycinamide formyltransferase n=1 Tax=Paenibacillus konkukensis TaxID=2020716 RepID=A0ABY4RV21_9BACL|nr:MULTISPECIES: phosphoribosylglycinamide formyltransferase [Paenibacillus]MCS7463756.1 phosphoribosylglycinamide formyltransferase [Paenibacillus doosanensis]UQZ85252.1 Phosphoribosylglycinamide formyltransferase [Paenibacillus konkukensis]
MIEPLRIAVFASGSGSNFQAIADAVHAGKLDARIELLVCDRPQAQVVRRAEAAGVPVHTFRPKDYPSREAYEQEILGLLKSKQVGLVVLAGYMRILTHVLVNAYWGRMMNIHPSLLPSFPGLHAVRQALDHGVKITGITVHLVDGGLDSGPILAQRALEIRPDDTEETLSARIHPMEHELLPWVIQQIADGSMDLERYMNLKPKDGIKS